MLIMHHPSHQSADCFGADRWLASAGVSHRCLCNDLSDLKTSAGRDSPSSYGANHSACPAEPNPSSCLPPVAPPLEHSLDPLQNRSSRTK